MIVRPAAPRCPYCQRVDDGLEVRWRVAIRAARSGGTDARVGVSKVSRGLAPPVTFDQKQGVIRIKSLSFSNRN